VLKTMVSDSSASVRRAVAETLEAFGAT
jgi:hypothetical protein